MTIPEIKKKWKNEKDYKVYWVVLTDSIILKSNIEIIKEFLADLDTLSECNCKKIKDQ